MRYATSVVLSTAVSAVAQYNFRANSIFDPDGSGAGHQPLGHDQWSAFYNHYVVLGSKIRVTANYGGTSPTTPQMFGVILNEDGTVISDIEQIAEQGLARYRMITMNPANTGPYRVRNTFSAKKFFNVKDVKDNIPRLGATFGQNPSDEANFVVFLLSANGLADAGQAVLVWVIIDYIVLLSEPKEIAKS